ncbi:MAG: 23S rRNA (pseudouridine(1915)-N(3))-methyltransferase RlmH [Janthinobacterium lividum]
MRSAYIIAVGKAARELNNLSLNYQKMIKASTKLIDISHSKKLPSSLIKEYEAKKILGNTRPKSFKIALDVLGVCMNSYEFADIIDKKEDVDFIIGGAFGLSPLVLNNVDLKLSLSRMTFPHIMAKIILLEQIYRAQTILENHPYHK